MGGRPPPGRVRGLVGQLTLHGGPVRLRPVRATPCFVCILWILLSSLRGDVAISAEASNGPNVQPHIPNGLKSLRGFCKPQKSTPVHLT